MAVSAAVPSLEAAYDHDLNLPPTFLQRFPSIAPLLRDERLLRLFHAFNVQAKAHKRSFHRLGVASVLFAAFPLLLAALRLAMGEAVFSRIGGPAIVADCCGVISIALLVCNRVAGQRNKWLTAMFLRERLRQWHFQTFLDGALVGKLVSAPAEFAAERDKRWLLLEQHLKSPPAMISTFLSADSRATDLFHAATPYANPQLAEQVAEVLGILRIDHQLGYSGQKMEAEGVGASMTLDEETSVSEWLASSSLVGAVVVAALAFFVSLSGLWRRELGGFDSQVIGRAFGGFALLLAVLSAVSRAYRTGKTLPDETESYQEYCDRIREVGAVFRASPLDQKFEQLELLEQEAAAELRRFLRMKTRATFIF